MPATNSKQNSVSPLFNKAVLFSQVSLFLNHSLIYTQFELLFHNELTYSGTANGTQSRWSPIPIFITLEVLFSDEAHFTLNG